MKLMYKIFSIKWGLFCLSDLINLYNLFYEEILGFNINIFIFIK